MRGRSSGRRAADRAGVGAGTPPRGAQPTLVHVTTVDLSLEHLLGPQLSAFVDAGYDVVAMSAPGEWVPAVERRGVRYEAIRHLSRSMSPTSDARALVELWQAFRRLRPAIVHTHNPKSGVLGRIAARAAGVPVVVNTVHGLYATPEDPFARRALVYAAERLAAAFSHAELVQNPEDVPVLRRLRVPAERLTLLGNGVDLARFGRHGDVEAARREVRQEWGVADGDVVVGTVGRLVLEKGYRELFGAWEVVRRAHPNARLVVIGPTEPHKADELPAAEVERARAMGVHFDGHRDDVERRYHGMDVFVLASHREGFPRAAMEAAASGLPIVATDIRGCRQVVEPGVTGLLVPVRTVEPLAAALTRLVDDAVLRRSMGEAAVRKAAAEFDDRRVVATTLAVYEGLLRRKGLRPPSPGTA